MEDLLHLPPPSISQTPFYAHILSSLPSLRLSIKDAVTASTKSWLFDVRQSGATVGKLALEQMANRIKKWRTKREKDGGVRLARVGGAMELVNNERIECEALCACRLRKFERSWSCRSRCFGKRGDTSRLPAFVSMYSHLRRSRLQARTAAQLSG